MSQEGEIIGVDRRWYPGPSEPVYVGVVLVAGAIGDYAAYAGTGPDEFIARCGDKLSFAEACVHFPGGQLERAKYRD